MTLVPYLFFSVHIFAEQTPALTLGQGSGSTNTQVLRFTGLGLGIGYTSFLQEHQAEVLTTIGPQDFGVSWHLGQSFLNYGGMKGTHAFDLDCRIRSLAAATRWFFWHESPLYGQVGTGLFLAEGTLYSTHIDVSTGSEGNATDFSIAGPFLYSQVGLAFTFSQGYYLDFTIRGVGKAWPLLYRSADTDDALSGINKELARSNLSAPKSYGLINLKVGVLL